MLMKSFNADSLAVKVYDTRGAMGRAAGEDAAAYIRTLLEEKDDIYMIFAAAPSQNEVLSTIASYDDIDWSRVHALHMDEYIGLPKDAPQGFGNYLRRVIFDKLPFASVDCLDSYGDAAKAMESYDRILKEHHIDVVFMGIGENGHIAFNDPHEADFNDTRRIKKVALDNVCRNQQVHDGCFKKLEDVPEYAITLTCPTLFSADRIFCVVPSREKANAVRETVTGPVSEKCPATILRRHAAATLYLDAESSKYII